MKRRRLQVKFGELAQEISIVHGISQDVVELVLNAYSAAVRRLLAEGLIVEIARGVRLEQQDYFDPRNAKPAKRIVVNAEYSRLRRSAGKTTEEIEKEHERTTEAVAKLSDGGG